MIGIGGSADLQNGVDGNIVLTSLAGLGLAPLADYGGPTQTVALLPGSVAIGAGTAESGVMTDQRGEPLDSPVDIGAFQSQGFTLTVAAGSTPQQTTNGTAFANPLALTVTAKNPVEPVAGGTVTFTVPSSGASAALTAGSVTLGVAGTASIIAADNSIAGSYNVTASTGGAGVVPFHLTNLVSSPVNNYYVNSASSGFSGSGTSGTLPYVLFLVNADANPGSGGIEVQFTDVFSTPQTITVGATLVLSRKSGPVVIAGPGAGLVTINGGGAVEVFDVDAMVTATISGLSIVNGNALSGGGIYNDGTLTISDCSIEDNQSTATFDGGGGIDNAGVLTIEQSLITGNSASESGDGGGILNNGVLTIDQSQITGNTAFSGGGLDSESGMATITNSLFSSNGASDGGAIQDGSNMTIVNCTIVSNAGQIGGGINSSVGGDDNSLLLTIEDCTIVGNVGDDLYNGDQPDPVVDVDVGNSILSNINADISSQGYNIIQHSAEGMGFAPTDLLNVNPLLGPLQNNGGPTMTMAPFPSSPAIDAGDNALIPFGVTADQRGAGYPRIVNHTVDIGAFEVQAGFHFVVTAQPTGSITAGTGFGLTVTAEDSSGAVDSSFSGTVTVAMYNNPGGATLGGMLTATAQAGVAVFSGLTIDKAATGYSLIVSGSGESGPATNAFDVTAAAATQLVVTSQPPQDVVARNEFGLIVSAEDRFGNVDPTFDGGVSVALLAHPGGATLGGMLSMAAQSGVANFSGLTLDQGGAGYSLQASATGLTDATTNAITVELPTVYTVDLTSNTGAGSGNAGDLVYTVGLANANTNPAGSVIEFDPSVFSTPQTITLAATLMLAETGGPEVIDGPGAGVVTVSGNNTTEVFNIVIDTVVSMSGLSIIDGNGTFGGGLFNQGMLTIINSTFTDNSALYGGAIYTRNGSLTLNGDTFSSNSASAESGAIDNWAGGTVTVTNNTFTGNSAPNGGAIGNEWGSVSVSNSTFSNNLASTGAGGAIINDNPSDAYSNSLSVVGCTISGNLAVNGGGIASGGPDALSLTNDTITGNSVTGVGGGLYNDGTTTLIDCTVTGNSAAGGGGGIANAGGALKIGDTIVAENTATTGGPDAQGYPVTSLGNNLIGEIDGSSGWNGSDLTGTSAQPLDPLLAPLGDYGGPTETIALLPGSPAIGAGTAVSGITTDQRGFALDSPPDIGAFQSNTLVVNTTSDGVVSPPGELSLRQAINLANALGGNETITFDPTVFATPQMITLTQGQLELDDTSGTETIEGPAAGVTISGGGQSRVFQIDNGVTAVLSGLTISGGSTTGNGGGVYDDGGTVTMTDCTVSGNTGNMGGGVFTTKLGTISITGCSLTGGSAGSGGAIYNDGGTVKLTDSTVSGNTGNMGGGVFNSKLGTIAITGCTMSGNSAAGGGALYNSGTATLSACTIGANSAALGGGIDNGAGGGATLEDTIVATNTGTGGAASDIGGDNAAGVVGTYDLVGPGGAGGIAGGTGDIVLASLTSPLLGPLGNYGGPTETMPLLPGSAALGAGAAIAGVTNDQRGFGVGATPDIGAFQAQPLEVNTTIDANTAPSGVLTLRQAVNLANQLNVAETITFDPTVFAKVQTITLTQGPLELRDTGGTETINGPAAGLTISGGGMSTVFRVDSGSAASLTGLTISDGSTTAKGGGLYNSGKTTLDDVTVSGNSAGDGGGLWNNGTVTLTNCTISGNSASGGGGLDDVSGGKATLTDCTVSGNTSSSAFAGIDVAGTATLTDTIVAGNTDTVGASDLGGPGSVSGSNNLVGTGGSGGLVNGVDGNIVGVANPGLAPLGDYGGPTETIALLPGSPAIGAGIGESGVTTDERGLTRPTSGPTDIGAFESSGFDISITSGSGQSAGVLTAFAAPLVVKVTADNPIEPVAGGRVLFTAPASGAAAALHGSPAPISATGLASVTAMANVTAGAYAVIASATGVTSAASFSLTNQIQPILSGLSAQAITYGSTVTITGTLAAGLQVPVGEQVTVTLHGVTHEATIATGGSFSTQFTSADVPLDASSTPYTVTYAYVTNGAFLAAHGSSLLTVDQAELTVSAKSVSSVYGAPLPGLSYTISGFVDGDTSSVVSGAPAITTTARSAPAPGPTRSRSGPGH